MNEKTQVKLSIPLIDEIELTRIDNYYNEIVSEYTKAFVKEREQIITQRLMSNLHQENAKLKEIIDQLEEWLEQEKYRLAKETSNAYEDSFGRIKFVNSDIFNFANDVLTKIQNLKGEQKNE